MFQTLEEQIKADEEKATPKRQRVMLRAVIAVVSVVLFGSLYFGIHFVAGG
ncbi:MAG TPA: hypothetical protein VKX49_08280 [Bryobacteraceae bacterium]|nr:hypothetical protein [Bryobacteraceae bacterium]